MAAQSGVAFDCAKIVILTIYFVTLPQNYCFLNSNIPTYSKLRLSLAVIMASLTTVVLSLLTSCSSTKFVPDDKYLLTDVTFQSDDEDFDVSKLKPYVRLKPNSKWFSLFKIPLGIYDLAGRDSTRWLNRTIKNLGEEPVIYDSVQARQTSETILSAMQNMGYLDAKVATETSFKGKKLAVKYLVSPAKQYFIDSVAYDIQDENIANLLQLDNPSKRGLRRGMVFSIDNLEQERRRLTKILNDNGYHRFNKDFIIYEADSIDKVHKVDVTLRLLRYRATDNAPEAEHSKYHIGNIEYSSGDGGGIHLRQRVLENNTSIRSGEPFSATKLQQTYNNFARLQAVKYTNIRFTERPDTTLLDCNIQLSTNKPSTVSFQPEGTNTAGDLGAAASLTYENRNLFRGSELLSIQLRAAFEAITGLEGYQNQNYEEYNIESKLTFPRFIAPFLSRSFRRQSNAQSELSISYNLQNRPEFHRRVFTTAWRYRWNEPRHHTTYRIDLIDLNYVYMPWISETFKQDYLDNASNRNAILRYNYEDLFIMKIGAGLTYNNGIHAFKANIETSGNLLNVVAHTTSMKKNDQGQYTLFNIAYAQYAKADLDYTYLLTFDRQNTLAMHIGMGIAYPYGNSNILPFEKRYFSGGANSVRGWNVRELGPGSFKGTDGRIDFINQTGDIKLDANVEYRTALFWKFDGALFVDAGNIWTIRNYTDQPGGQFRFNKFYKQIAASYGLGLRLNLDYFIIRIDMGMKAINPSYNTKSEHYPIAHPKFSRDYAFHFAVGMPF